MNTIYFNGVAVGHCETLPGQESLTKTKELPPIKTSFSWTATFRIKSGKKRRRWSQWLHDLKMGKADRRDVKHYRRVKHHQLRKRFLKK